MKNKIHPRIPGLILIVVFCIALPLSAQGYLQMEKQVVEKTLANGLRVLVLERHDAPVVSFVTWANVGSVNEVKGITGISHVLEHMAFKGTRTIGTHDIENEIKAMTREDETFDAWREEYARGELADSVKLNQLEAAHRAAIDEAKKYVVTNELARAIETAGGEGLNAGTSYDQTIYYCSLPSNKTELWMSLESERFLDPVLREFYTEKGVVMEERRLRSESQPLGRLLEEFLTTAFKAHPYGEPLVGHMSDLKTFSRQDAADYFKAHYTPGNLVIAIVGDVQTADVLKMVNLYWGRLPAGEKPRPVFTQEPPQPGQKRIEMEDAMQPVIILGYHRPSALHQDSAVLDAITDVLGQGRTCRLYKSMVKEKKIAIVVEALAGLTQKYPGLYIFLALPSQGHTAAECEEAILAEIEKIKKEPLSAEELTAVKTRAKVNFLRGLDSNLGIAVQLARAETLYGSYSEMFKEVGKIETIQAQDIQRVASEIFVKRNSTVAVIVPPAKAN